MSDIYEAALIEYGRSGWVHVAPEDKGMVLAAAGVNGHANRYVGRVMCRMDEGRCLCEKREGWSPWGTNPILEGMRALLDARKVRDDTEVYGDDEDREQGFYEDWEGPDARS